MIHTDSSAINKTIRSGTWYEELNPDGRMKGIHYSVELRRMLGYETEEEFPNTLDCLLEHIHPKDRRYMLERAIAAGTGTADGYDVEYRIRKKTGEYLLVNATGKRLCTPDGTPFVIFGVVIDISEAVENKKLHEKERTMEFNQRFLDIFSKEYLTVWLIDPENHRMTLLRNNRDTKITRTLIGLSQEKSYDEVIEYYIDRFVVSKYKDSMREKTAFSYLVEHVDEGKLHQVQYAIINLDGEKHYFMFCSTRLTNEEGKFMLACGFRDIDAIVDEEKRKQKELEEAREAAEAANVAKTSFLFNMSHDIRTPMNAIMGFRDLLEKHQEVPEKRAYYLMRIKESSEVLLSIINNVLEMARIEKGTVEIEETAWSIEQLHDSLTSVFQEIMEQKGIAFSWELNAQNPYIYCDATKIREVFYNLLSNAFKYTKQGGSVQMSVEEISSDKQDVAIFRTTISDTGIGMSEEFLSHLFEEFARERCSKCRKTEGTGLGMAIVKRFVDLMQGTIEVQSTKDVGSTFIVTLPHRIARREDLDEHEKIGISPEQFKGKKILLAEDNEINAEIAQAILTEAGFKVTCAADGAICVDILQSAEVGCYDVILMDIQMPNMNGYDATMAIRALPDKRKANIPIIAMTANAFEEDKRNARNAGMNGHVAKPIRVQQLMQELSKALSV